MSIVWYAHVAPGRQGVYQTWKEVDRLASLYPFSKFRKFTSELEAWTFVQRNKVKLKWPDVVRYGSIFPNHYLTLTYFVRDNTIYANLNTQKLGYVRIASDKENISISNTYGLTTIQISNVALDNMSIVSHTIALYRLIELIGPLVDVEIVVPDHSIYYVISAYTGTKIEYCRLQQQLRNRLGAYALTLYDFYTITED